jgi:hypothetical protein
MGVQAGIWARAYSTTPQEISDWLPGDDELRLRTIQRLHRKGFRLWTRRFHTTYRIGLLLLLLGLADALVPKHGIHAFHALAIAIALAGCGVECLWIGANWVLRNSRDWEILTGGEVIDTTYEKSWIGRVFERAARGLEGAARLLIPVITVEPPGYEGEPVQSDPGEVTFGDLQNYAKALESQAKALEIQARALESQAKILESQAESLAR